MLTNIAIILTNAFQQLAGRFILGILRHQFAAKSFGKRGRGEFLYLDVGGLVAGFKVVCGGVLDFV